MESIRIFSDGGSNGRGGSGSATIIRTSPEHFLHIICNLGEATNNEAEIFGGLVGFYLLNHLSDLNPKNAQIVWSSDSQYALKSASEYIKSWQKNGWKTAAKEAVKNQGLWKIYLALTVGLKFNTEHVKGHSGHVENEACDTAVSWVRDRGYRDKPSIIEVDYEPWIIIDCRKILAIVREITEIPSSQEAQDIFSPIIKAIQILTNGSLNLAASKITKPEKNPEHAKQFIKNEIELLLNNLRKLPELKEVLTTEADLKKILKELKDWSKKLE